MLNICKIPCKYLIVKLLTNRKLKVNGSNMHIYPTPHILTMMMRVNHMYDANSKAI